MAARKRKNHRNQEAETQIDGLIPPGRLLAIRLLIVIALAISAYLAFLSLTGTKAVGCAPDSGCDQVMSSRWSSWFGIPVSLFAVLADAVFLAGTFQLARQFPIPRQRRAWGIIVPCAVLLTGAALWFIFLQLVILRTICPYCMASHAAGLLAALLALISAPISEPPEKTSKLDRTVFITNSTFRRSVGLALFGVAALVTGQIVHTPKTYVEISQNIVDKRTTAAPPTATPPPATSPVTNVARTDMNLTGRTSEIPRAIVDPSPGTPAPTRDAPGTGVSSAIPAFPATSPFGQRPFPLYGGRFYLDVADIPTLGSPTNAHVAVTLHDFTCSHCRELHLHLVEAQHIFSNQLVIVMLPMPFDPNCNPIMQRHNPKHTNACEYARLSLAVFRANRARQHDYDEFLFTGEKPPPILLARERAAEAVGIDALDKALTDPWIDQQIRLGIALYDTASRAGHASLPQLMIGQQVAVGILPADVLLDMLEKNLGLTVKTSSSTTRLP